jgi:Nif-specific regulatory protein
MAEKDPIFVADLPANIKASKNSSVTPGSVFSADREGMSEEVERFEKREIINALKNCGFVKQRAARLLGITPRQLTYRMKKYAIDARKL